MNKIAAILWCILSLAWTTASWAQNVAVSGKVTGANGEAIIGANVLVEGTTQGITTNVDGDYTLTNVPANATLVVSYLGYKTEKIPVGNKTRIDVTLREDTAEIEGVMVVAYGTAKKESFTGSAAVVKGGELQKRVVGNVTKSFEGTVAGVQVASGGGQPGEAAVDQQGGQHQGLPHGGAGAVQSEKGNTKIPQAKGGADALVQQIPRQHAVQIAGLQPRLIQRPLQDLPLHGGLRLFPCFLPEKGVAAQLVKISGQRPLPLHPSADVGEGQH